MYTPLFPLCFSALRLPRFSLPLHRLPLASAGFRTSHLPLPASRRFIQSSIPAEPFSNLLLHILLTYTYLPSAANRFFGLPPGQTRFRRRTDPVVRKIGIQTLVEVPYEPTVRMGPPPPRSPHAIASTSYTLCQPYFTIRGAVPPPTYILLYSAP
jgi:hypothetical protein